MKKILLIICFMLFSQNNADAITAFKFNKWDGASWSWADAKKWNGTTWSPIEDYYYHFFVARGQSNATGGGDWTLSPAVTNGSLEILVDGTIQPLADPVGLASSPWSKSQGSLYPSFANKYYELTGHKIILLHTTLGGSGLTRTTAYSPTWWWSGAGQLGEQSDAICDASITALRAAGYHFILMGQLWYQGESDIDLSTATYQSNLNTFFNDYVAHFSSEWPDIKNYVFKINDSIYATYIRAAQDAIAAQRADTMVVWENPYTYDGQLANYPATQGVHLTQAQYNECGEEAATTIAGAE